MLCGSTMPVSSPVRGAQPALRSELCGGTGSCVTDDTLRPRGSSIHRAFEMVPSLLHCSNVTRINPGWPSAHNDGLRGSPRNKEEGSMGHLRNFVSRLRREDAGQGMAEYALLAGLIAVVAIGAVTLLGGNITTTLNSIATAIGGGS